ncbi:transglutaminase-like domain-containing protein [Paenibacillus timonensis]|uniref:Transglutaminase family protein n=1 Tax=Paenibacillus timonensis TaxID=225915 RepID=A0ABW3SAS6_9BACL|nr:transglutaminase-like domain-containing protein [Paenibacillus timonensis]MCH1639285.1 transglutaminase-like domain-containing protein [Paenibacillus timonensis]
MRKWISVALAILILFGGAGATQVHGSESPGWIDKTRVDQGAIRINYDVKTNIKTKVLIAKGEGKYTYTLTSGPNGVTFPLQMGNGEYTVSLLEQIKGTTYRLVHKGTVKLQLQDEKQVFLHSTQNVNWEPDGRAAKIAYELTQKAVGTEEKVKIIYDYVTSTIKYDDRLAFSATSSYLPDLDRTLTEKKDICYGFSSLFAAMLRSVGIPAKLAMGTSDYVSTYHAWNEVYVNGSWITIDTTADAGWKGTTTAFTMIKDPAKYKTEKVY